MQSDRHASPLSRTFQLIVASPRMAFGALFAIAAGMLGAMGFQPLGFWPLTFVSVIWLLEMVAHAGGGRKAFALGWFYGLGHFTIGNNWIATAFTYQAQLPAWLGMLAVVLIALYLALFPAFASYASWWLARLDRGLVRTEGDALPPDAHQLGASAFVRFVLAFGASWIVSEWVRSWLFSGFAWNPLGVVLLGAFDGQGLAILAPWVGTYGLSGVCVLLAGLVGICARVGAQSTNSFGRLVWGLPVVLVGLGVSMAMLATKGSASGQRAEGGVPYTLVQPNLRQDLINDPAQFEGNFRKLAMMSLPRDLGDRRVVFWPESGLGDYLRDGYPAYIYQYYTYAGDPVAARKRIGQMVGPYGVLMAGAVDLVMEDGKEVAARNSITVIDGEGAILAGYSKAHLVPFGEYLPLRSVLEPLGLSRFVVGSLDFWSGPGPRTLDFGTYGKVGMQICYEIIFSGEVVDPKNRPDYIFNPSNDGWFGAWGPPQHLAQARLRALEEGIPVVRSTTTGISAVIDGDGIVRDFIPHLQAGRLDGHIPPVKAPTLFAQFGNVLPLALAFLLGLASFCMVALNRQRG